MERILGLDLGTNSIGFALNKVEEKDSITIFNELASNSIIFSEYVPSTDRRAFRSGRRRNERASRRKENIRKLFCYFNLASKNILDNPIEYFNNLTKLYKEPYSLREEAIKGKKLSKDEFTFALYTIISRRGYTNLFAKEEDENKAKESEKINSAILNNKNIYKNSNYTLPSKVLTLKKEELEEDGFINIAIRNKKDNYNNSLDRKLWQEEAELLIESQKNNIELFKDIKTYEDFKNKFINGVNKNSKGIFEQRNLKSVEDMVGFCSFYNLYSKEPQKRVINAHIKAIEFVLRQRIENSILGNLILNKKTGEFVKISKEDIETTINFWLYTPNVQTITAKNIFKNAGLKDLEIQTSDKQDDTVQDISVHKALLEIVDFETILKNEEFYSKLLEVLHYFVSEQQIKDEIKKLNKENILSEEQIDKIANINKAKSSYLSFSLKFIDEILQKLKNDISYQTCLEELGYFKRYTQMEAYNYLPPLNPSIEDIKWLEKNVKNFKSEQLFYQPLISPNVKRVISILRRLVNELISKYGKIDKIIIETARELNSKKDEDKIKKSQEQSNKEIKDAQTLLKSGNKELSNKNILRARLLKEQKSKCLYSGEGLTLEEALDENITEIEHFIPRSKIWIDSYKNKILVLKKYNQNKSNQHPVSFLKSIGKWENFVGRVDEFIANKDKKICLTDEKNIQKIWDNEKLEDRFLNDTRSATKIVANYLEHYLFPKQNEYGKGESNDKVIRVTGKAINELKKLWGINEAQPKNEEGKKDRDTNYHHTIDAIVISLLNNSSKKALNDFFKQKEDKFKTKAILEKLKTRFPISKNGKSLFEFVKDKVEKYEKNELYVCPYMKKRENIRGFKDGNIKLIWDKELNNFSQIDKVEINKKLLLNNFGKDLKDDEVKKEFEKIKDKLNLPKQNNIKIALEEYEKRLLEIRKKINNISEEIKQEQNNLPRDKKAIETVEILEIKNRIEKLEQTKKEFVKELEFPCFFYTKDGKKQIVRSLNLKSNSVTKADSIIITDKKQKNRVQRLTKEVYENLKSSKTPFVAKLNDNTLSVDLYNTLKGQLIGLNYFSSIKNDILPKIDERKIKLISNYDDKITVSKNNIIEIEDLKNGTKNYYTCNGGGEIGKGKNVIKVDNINTKNKSVIPIQIADYRIVKPVKINFFGKISYEEFKKN
ncbi:CRISPR/Cas system-associated RNA-guided endonuclease Cas9, type II-C [Aliarcobacter faecis]|uniref:type II CRISPR RNA-guided endonuclease Cas9 n=1 Tax=Aliarcobacter faecis TaxID=1564138 RepID=UPI00047C298A|nr:type II CRISPR RNA-guided endonuclease Cas9 [Aliarcobacter faecis]QKF72642.1 CRISPR/Cas system-associated RNA-guided endonuclease Cas9, type II-C [Aliarcobacter faecis]